MSSSKPKQYGLILPSKNKDKIERVPCKKFNILLDSDDELERDEESPLNWVEASLKKSAGNSGQHSLQKRLLREALEEDESVFQYDEVYDSIQENKTSKQAVKDSSKKPKYIQNLIKHAEKRKLESERRNERKVQKEREAEGEEFADKESFVTASYLKKMEELKKAEEEAKLQERREELIDVTKHKNFGVFYNHLFRQKFGETSIKEEPMSEDQVKENSEYKTSNQIDAAMRQEHSRSEQESPPSLQGSPNCADSKTSKNTDSLFNKRSKRSEREKGNLKYKNNDEIREGKSTKDKEIQNSDMSHSKRRQESRSHPSDSQQEKKEQRISHGNNSSAPNSNTPRSLIKKEKLSPDRNDAEYCLNDKRDTKVSNKKPINDPVEIKKESEQEEKDRGQEEKERGQEEIQKLFTKRTVGKMFVEAVERYYQRKAEREAKG